MVCGTFTVQDVPAEALQETMDIWRGNDPPPMTVTSSQNADGTYTVTAVFPPCPEGTTHEPRGSKSI